MLYNFNKLKIIKNVKDLEMKVVNKPIIIKN